MVTLRRLFGHESAAGVLLVLAAAVALALSSSPLSRTVETFLDTPVLWRVSPRALVNDGLMAIFFFVVGLDVRHELSVGELNTLRKALLPAIAALGGMLAPALLYLAFGGNSRGWGVPTATDIAFVIGVLSLLGNRVNRGLAVFIVALAVFDDIGGVAIIAVFYGGALHPALLGFIVAMLVPSGLRDLLRARLRPMQLFVVMPLFALANAGVDLRALPHDVMADRILLGTCAALVFGKPLGIVIATWLAVKLRLASLPTGATWRALVGVALLGGIGFTVALFIAALAFPAPQELLSAKIGVLSGSIVAAIVGCVWLAAPFSRREMPREPLR